LKAQYVTAEFADPTCQNAYLAHQSAWGKEERKRTRDALISARINFYKEWAAKYMKENKPKPLTEEDFPA